jgi:hypothetical protein
MAAVKIVPTCSKCIQSEDAYSVLFHARQTTTDCVVYTRQTTTGCVVYTLFRTSKISLSQFGETEQRPGLRPIIECSV